MSNTKKVIKIQCPFERIKKHNTHPEAALYKAAIMQLIIDASNTSKDPRACRNEKRAKEWLFSGSDDFYFTCAMAGMNPKIVIKLARELIGIHRQNTETFHERKKKMAKKEIEEKMQLFRKQKALEKIGESSVMLGITTVRGLFYS